MITEQELNEIESRWSNTQPGPWKAYIEGRDHESGADFIMTGVGQLGEGSIEMIGATVEDYDFMAAAKQDIPLLIAEIRRLQNG